jgi:Ca2+-binding RTX toxin-like protein
VILDGGLDTIGPAPTFNATAGNVFGTNYDLLNLDMSDRRGSPAADTSIVVVSTVSGVASLTGFQNVNFRDIEAINLCDQDLLTRTAMGDLYVRTTEGNDIVQFSRYSGNTYRVRINSTFLYLAATTRTVVYGRAGNDTIQQTNVTLPLEAYGEEGNDYLSGYYGDDLLVGGPGDDRLLGSSGENQLWGDNLGEQDLPAGGNDQISGGLHVDVAYGGGGIDTINLGGGNDYAFGGWGNDLIDGMEGDDRLYGGEGDDTISGYTGNDLIAGNGGNDFLYGKDGHDVIIGGLGADLLAGDAGDDLLINGTASYSPPGGTDASTSVNDANDAAMLLLLADWVANKPALPALSLLTTPDDNTPDTLGGGEGTDRTRPGTGDTGDWDGVL